VNVGLDSLLVLRWQQTPVLAGIHVMYRVVATDLYVSIDRVVVGVVVVEYELVQEEEVGDGAHEVAGVVVLRGRVASVMLEHVE